MMKKKLGVGSQEPKYSKKISVQKRVAFYTIYFVVVILFFELSFRAFYAISYKNPSIVWAPFHALDRYYPGIIKEMNTDLPQDDGVFDILFLGGSVLTPAWGDIENQLLEMWQDSVNQPIKIHNMASAAHTSRDSRIKYDLLSDKNYDLVFVYHGINSTRFNNCPDSVFKNDYGHVDFYNKVNMLATSNLSRWSILPLLYETLKTNVFKTYAEDNFLSFHAPTRGRHKYWIKYGTDIKTAYPFEKNYEHIIDAALARNQHVLISSFAFYIPENYTLKRFNAHQLDYGAYKNPVELWGTVETVTKGINRHNQVIADLITKYGDNPNFLSVDINVQIVKDSQTFDDLCHLTELGSREFVEIMWPAIQQIKLQPNRKYSNAQ